MGSHTGFDLTSGSRNTLIGTSAGANITTANENVAIGDNCLISVTTQTANVAIGHDCLESCTDSSNTAVGHEAMKSASSATVCTAVGRQAGFGITTGDSNSCFGENAGAGINSGANNTCLGRDSGTANGPSGSIGSSDNVVCLGDNNVQSLFCADTSISSSDSRDKTDVASFNIGLDWINALRPVTYKWDRRTWYGTKEEPFGTPDGSKKRSKTHIGFLAQEALEVEKANGYGTSNDDSLIVNLTPDGMSYGMKYERLVPILVNAIKELSVKVTALEAG